MQNNVKRGVVPLYNGVELSALSTLELRAASEAVSNRILQHLDTIDETPLTDAVTLKCVSNHLTADQNLLHHILVQLGDIDEQGRVIA